LRDKSIIVYNEIIGNTHILNVIQAYYVVSKLFGEIKHYIVKTPEQLLVTVKRIMINHDTPSFIHIKSTSSDGLDFKKFIEKYNKFRRIRLCHKEFKDRYWRILPSIKGQYRFFVVGVKTTDSHVRRKRWNNYVNTFRTNKYIDIAISPIYDFTNNEIWSIIKSNGIVLETYNLCNDSLNCSYCPFRGKRKQQVIDEFMSR